MIYQALADLEKNNQRGALCVVVRAQGSTPRRATSKMLVYPDGHILGTVGGGEVERRVIQEALQAIQDGQSRYLEYNMSDPQRGDPGVCGGQMEVFVDPVQPKPTLVVIGAGHVGKAVAWLADWLGFYVVVSDDRPEFCTAQAVPSARAFFPGALEDLPGKLEMTTTTYLVLTTRSVDIDVPGLPSLLASPAAYIGVIGSRRRWETTRKKLLEMGLSQHSLERVRSPMGLDIQAETPEEIAVSVLAEIIKLRNTKK